MATAARAQDGNPGIDAPVVSSDVTPPSLKTQAEAIYPADALRDRIEGTVGLELDIDADGKVTDARVTTKAGHGFDEAAVAAAKQFVFDPARKGAGAIASKVQFSYEFHLPAKATDTAKPVEPKSPPAGGAKTDKPLEQSGDDQSTLVLASRPISAASSFSVRDRDFSLRPVGSVQDILRVTPGLIMVQHSGGGKANQYFLRGFDADHGTDLALAIDGIPINMVSHAHGQGFADTNFIIPEVVERIEITKGPYFAEQGDFATAGSLNMITRKEFEHSSLGFGYGGSPGHGGPLYRGLLIASPKFEGIRPLFAAEIGRQDGPFDNPEGWNKYKLFNKITFDLSPTSTLSFGESSYGGDWHGSGQIPARSVALGTVDRFGSIDPNEGGNTARHQLFASYKVRPSERSEVEALVFMGQYRFDLYSNFTLYLNDAENGDEIHQVDRRTFVGGKVSYHVVHDLRGVRFDTRFGASLRNDDIHNQLWNTRERQNLAIVRDNNVHETSIGAYVREEVALTKWLRVLGGLRSDFFAFAVDNSVEKPGDPAGPSSGVTGASQLSPKAALVVTPLASKDANVDVYVNYGHGFHSNDARGVILNPKDRVTPITRAIGSEVGTRGRFFGKLDAAVAFWQLDLANETVWNGDDGTTAVSGATHRQGVELETRYELTDWLAADLDLTFTKSALKENSGNGNGLALAPKRTWSGGVSARHPSGFRAGLRFYGIGDRPASDDGGLVATGFTQFDLHAGFRHRWWDIAIDVENLLNAKYRSAQFATTGRLRDEPPTSAPPPPGTCGGGSRLAPLNKGNFAGCDDVHFTPAYPFTLRVMATAYLD